MVAVIKVTPNTKKFAGRVYGQTMYSSHHISSLVMLCYVITWEQIVAMDGLSLSSIDDHKEVLDRDKSLAGQGDELHLGFSLDCQGEGEGEGEAFDREVARNGQGDGLDRAESITGHDEGLGRAVSLLEPLLLELQLRSFSGVTGDLRLSLNLACDSAAVRPPWYISIVVRRRRDSFTLRLAAGLRGDAGWQAA